MQNRAEQKFPAKTHGRRGCVQNRMNGQRHGSGGIIVRGHTDAVMSVCVTDKYVVSGSDDDTVRLTPICRDPVSAVVDLTGSNVVELTMPPLVELTMPPLVASEQKRQGAAQPPAKNRPMSTKRGRENSSPGKRGPLYTGFNVGNNNGQPCITLKSLAYNPSSTSKRAAAHPKKRGRENSGPGKRAKYRLALPPKYAGLPKDIREKAMLKIMRFAAQLMQDEVQKIQDKAKHAHQASLREKNFRVRVLRKKQAEAKQFDQSMTQVLPCITADTLSALQKQQSVFASDICQLEKSLDEAKRRLKEATKSLDEVNTRYRDP